jgi:hypothetical protein
MAICHVVNVDTGGTLARVRVGKAPAVGQVCEIGGRQYAVVDRPTRVIPCRPISMIAVDDRPVGQLADGDEIIVEVELVPPPRRQQQRAAARSGVTLVGVIGVSRD